ncbi:MAG: hypothetical protein KAH26_04485, partial [Bacteroidales bacterium]|nr:hypothetical protein [Bacteroidales bacterium]
KRHCIKKNKKDLKDSQEKVENGIKFFLRHGKESDLCFVKKIGHDHLTNHPKNQQSAINNGAPHEKLCEKL